jgi:hypothetical protein
MQATEEKILSILISVSENSEGDSDSDNDYLQLHLGHKGIAHLDRMVVAARMVNGDVTVGTFPIFDMGHELVEASIVCDQHGRLSISSFERVKHAWPIETTSDATLTLAAIKDIYDTAEKSMTVFAPWFSVTLYATPTDELEETEEFMDLLYEVMTGDEEESVEAFGKLFQGESDRIITQSVEVDDLAVKDVFLVSGRQSGDDDDTCYLVEADDDGEASDKFKSFLREEAVVFEGEDEPEFYINESVLLANAIDHRLR